MRVWLVAATVFALIDLAALALAIVGLVAFVRRAIRRALWK